MSLSSVLLAVCSGLLVQRDKLSLGKKALRIQRTGLAQHCDLLAPTKRGVRFARGMYLIQCVSTFVPALSWVDFVGAEAQP